MDTGVNAEGRKRNDTTRDGVDADGDINCQFFVQLLIRQQRTYGLAVCDGADSQLTCTRFTQRAKVYKES